MIVIVTVGVTVGVIVSVVVIVMLWAALPCMCHRLFINKFLSKQYPSFYSSSSLLLLS